MKIIGLIRKCTPVSRHGWFETDEGFNIRKPLYMISDLLGYDGRIEEALPMQDHVVSRQESFWLKFKTWFVNLFQ